MWVKSLSFQNRCEQLYIISPIDVVPLITCQGCVIFGYAHQQCSFFLGLKPEEKRANQQYDEYFLTHIVSCSVSKFKFWAKVQKNIVKVKLIHTKNTDAGEERSLLCFKAKGCPKGHGCRRACFHALYDVRCHQREDDHIYEYQYNPYEFFFIQLHVSYMHQALF